MPSLLDRILNTFATDYRSLRTEVDALKAQQERMMTTQAEFNERMTKMDAATTEIANDLQKLRDDLASGGPISAENLALLDAKIARLEVLGTDPTNPVPDEV